MRDDALVNTGLVLDHGRLLYGHGHGFGRWLPRGIQQAIVSAWNPAACAILGHDWFDYREVDCANPDRVACVCCCKEVSPATYDAKYREGP